VRQSPSCVKRCISQMKVCELSDESSETVRRSAKTREVLRLSEMRERIGKTQDVVGGTQDVVAGLRRRGETRAIVFCLVVVQGRGGNL
jgi:hypothetical protein